MATDGNSLEPKQPKTISTGSSGITKLSNSGAIGQGLKRLATLYCRDLNPSWLPLWEQALTDLDPIAVENGFLELERSFIPTSACPFPTPAHLRKPIQEAEKLHMAQEAENAWQDFMAVMEKHWFPDMGWRKGLKENPLVNARLARAVEAAGGVQAIYTSTREQLVWRKKEFLEAYFRSEQLESAGEVRSSEELPPSVRTAFESAGFTVKKLVG